MATRSAGTPIYRISELARSVGLSRTAILYYEKIGLLKARRAANGYRLYSDADRQQLCLLQQLQAGGLTLQECRACLTGRIDRDLLTRRLGALDAEIADKRRARDLLAALLGWGSLREWHETVERAAPDLHRNWLMTQGFSSEEAARVAVLSRDMNDHDAYMCAFLAIFAGLDYWGPGTPEATARALDALPFTPERVLEIGCGNGVATLVLAERTEAKITATDTETSALARLRARADAAGLGDRIEAQAQDMAVLSDPAEPYDLIWAEGSAYIIGVERALRDWWRLLRPGGALVFSDMVWRTDAPSDAVRGFWASEYPDMTTPARRVEQAQQAGYRVLTRFDMGQEALDAYYRPLEARLEAMAGAAIHQRVMDDLQAELSVYREGKGQFGYEMFVLQRD
jgi:DNA-binding transcriptional MerR regulator/cyclopropane fatty-acyl-phospholipid synthase-like methyltransferase